MMEFMALLAGHIPSPYEPLVYYYGIYSSSYRGKEKRENGENEEEVKVEEATGKPKASSTWARLIRKIFEVDVLRCKKCGGTMKVIAFITDFCETKKILQHTGEETQRAPPLSFTTTAVSEPGDWYCDYVPPDEAYFRDEEYAY